MSCIYIGRHFGEGKIVCGFDGSVRHKSKCEYYCQHYRKNSLLNRFLRFFNSDHKKLKRGW